MNYLVTSKHLIWLNKLYLKENKSLLRIPNTVHWVEYAQSIFSDMRGIFLKQALATSRGELYWPAITKKFAKVHEHLIAADGLDVERVPCDGIVQSLRDLLISFEVVGNHPQVGTKLQSCTDEHPILDPWKRRECCKYLMAHFLLSPFLKSMSLAKARRSSDQFGLLSNNSCHILCTSEFWRALGTKFASRRCRHWRQIATGYSFLEQWVWLMTFPLTNPDWQLLARSI